MFKKVPRGRPRRRPKRPSQPMNRKSMFAVSSITFCLCLILFVLWYYYPYNELQLFVQHTDIDQEHYTQKLLHMTVHPNYEHWIRRHNKNNESLFSNISSINNHYNPLNAHSLAIDGDNDHFVELSHTDKSHHDIQQLFVRYLQPICVQNNILSHDYLEQPLPNDCTALLARMVNISESQLFNEHEMNALAQRIEYLTHIRPQNGRYLIIHIPHTATQALIQNVVAAKFAEHAVYHYQEHADLSERPHISNTDGIQVMYGHLPFGFDQIFIAQPEEKEEEEEEDEEGSGYVLSVSELEKMEAGDDEKGKWKDLWINKLNFTYYTVLRDPVDLLVASYYDVDNKRRYKDLDEFVEDKANRNVIAKYLSGRDLDTWYAVQTMETHHGGHKSVHDVLVNADDYVVARNHLLSMGWVGLFEALTQSVKQLRWLWKMEDVLSELEVERMMKNEVNKNFEKPFNVKLTMIQHETLLKRNKWDVMLYELATVLYEQQQIVLKYGNA